MSEILQPSYTPEELESMRFPNRTDAMQFLISFGFAIDNRDNIPEWWVIYSADHLTCLAFEPSVPPYGVHKKPFQLSITARAGILTGRTNLTGYQAEEYFRTGQVPDATEDPSNTEGITCDTDDNIGEDTTL